MNKSLLYILLIVSMGFNAIQFNSSQTARTAQNATDKEVQTLLDSYADDLELKVAESDSIALANVGVMISVDSLLEYTDSLTLQYTGVMTSLDSVLDYSDSLTLAHSGKVRKRPLDILKRIKLFQSRADSTVSD